MPFPSTLQHNLAKHVEMHYTVLKRIMQEIDIWRKIEKNQQKAVF